MRLEFSAPFLESLNGKRQNSPGERSGKLQTHRRVRRAQRLCIKKKDTREAWTCHAPAIFRIRGSHPRLRGPRGPAPRGTSRRWVAWNSFQETAPSASSSISQMSFCTSPRVGVYLDGRGAAVTRRPALIIRVGNPDRQPSIDGSREWQRPCRRAPDLGQVGGDLGLLSATIMR
jgi:hypothetical protein